MVPVLLSFSMEAPSNLKIFLLEENSFPSLDSKKQFLFSIIFNQPHVFFLLALHRIRQIFSSSLPFSPISSLSLPLLPFFLLMGFCSVDQVNLDFHGLNNTSISTFQELGAMGYATLSGQSVYSHSLSLSLSLSPPLCLSLLPFWILISVCSPVCLQTCNLAVTVSGAFWS